MTTHTIAAHPPPMGHDDAAKRDLPMRMYIMGKRHVAPPGFSPLRHSSPVVPYPAAREDQAPAGKETAPAGGKAALASALGAVAAHLRQRQKKTEDERRLQLDDPNKAVDFGVRRAPDSTELVVLKFLTGWLFFPEQASWLSSVLGFLLVAPLTNFAWLSLDYQMYLAEIFHTVAATRAVHRFCMPFITWSYGAVFAQFVLSDFLAFDAFGVTLHPLNLGTLVMGLFAALYYYWGRSEDLRLFGVLMQPVVFLLWISGLVWYEAFKLDPLEATWYAPTEFAYNPLVIGAAFSLLASFSHAFEWKIPPRVNSTSHWRTFEDFLSKETVSKAAAVIGGIWLWGAVDELLAAPRVFGVFVLEFLFHVGYAPAKWAEMQKLVRWSLKYGDPALDYIGRGGASPPATPRSKKKKMIPAVQALRRSYHRARSGSFC